MIVVEEKSDRLTAFRLPAKLLSEIDACCESLDLTRSQVYRRAVNEFIKKNRDRFVTAYVGPRKAA